MRTTILAALLCLAASLLLPSSALAQQGHPLAGIWLGSWGTEAKRNDIVLELYWRDTTLSGNINPGFPDAAVIDTGVLDSTNWTVHLEAVGKDEQGNVVRTVVDGQLDKLGSPNRTLSGNWQRGSMAGAFTLARE